MYLLIYTVDGQTFTHAYDTVQEARRDAEAFAEDGIASQTCRRLFSAEALRRSPEEEYGIAPGRDFPGTLPPRPLAMAHWPSTPRAARG